MPNCEISFRVLLGTCGYEGQILLEQTYIQHCWIGGCWFSDADAAARGPRQHGAERGAADLLWRQRGHLLGGRVRRVDRRPPVSSNTDWHFDRISTARLP